MMSITIEYDTFEQSE